MKRKIMFFTFLLAGGILFLTACSREKEIMWTSESSSEAEIPVPSNVELTQEENSLEEPEKELEDIAKNSLVVYICGAVHSPGVYEFDRQSRIIDAVNAAGGFLDSAAPEYINLAAVLQDGSRIVIPTIEQAKELEKAGNGLQIQEEPAGEKIETAADARININTADETMLCSLTGIGASRARDIITYREEHGQFKRIEEIMNVTGIKEGSYAKIKDRITVE